MPFIQVEARFFRGALRRKLEKDIRNFNREAMKVARRGAVEGARMATAEGIVDLRAYVAGFKAIRTMHGAEIVNTARHAIFVERGRRPGARMPPFDPILGWVQRKLGTSDRGVVFLVRRAIATKGIPPKRIMFRLTRKVRRWFRQAVREAWIRGN